MDLDQINLAVDDIEKGILFGTEISENSLKLALKSLKVWLKVHDDLYSVQSTDTNPDTFMQEMHDVAIIRCQFNNLQI